jgi:hypothetical protein
MARWLPTIAVVIAVIALGVALFRPPETPSVDYADLEAVQAAVQADVDAATATQRDLADRIDALERSASAEPAVDVVTELETVKRDVGDLSAGLENACSAIGALSSRIDDIQSFGLTPGGATAPRPIGSGC